MASVKIATIKTHANKSEADIDVNEIKTVIQQNKIGDLPVVIIAIAGIARRGKSFFLNLLIAYLKHIKKHPDTDFNTTSSVISGMSWAGGKKAVTKGIWLWNEAFIIKRKDNSEVAILLTDTQGICDGIEGACPQVDSQIFFITLSMATIYIHNLDKEWKMPERSIYQICHSFHEVYGKGNQNDEPLFNSLTLLYRNWASEGKLGLSQQIYNEEVNDSKDNPMAEKIVKGIDKLFRHKIACVFPEPSEAVRKSSGLKEMSTADIGKEFLNTFERFANDLFSPYGHYSKQMNSAVTGNVFVERMEDLSEMLKSWPELTEDADQLRQVYVRDAYESAKKLLEKESPSIISPNDKQAFEEQFKQAETLAVEQFKVNARNVKPADKIYRYYLGKLQRAAEKIKALRIHEYEYKILEGKLQKLKSDNDELQKLIDQGRATEDQKKQHENNTKKIESIGKKIKAKTVVIGILKGISFATEVSGTVMSYIEPVAPVGKIMQAAGSLCRTYLEKMD